MEPAINEQEDKFTFVQRLATDLSSGTVDLPSFPDIVLRVRKALADDETTTQQLVQLIGAEPVLAARLLNVANSAALRPSGDPISDLNMAVNRIGRIMLRNTAMSFAMQQLQKASKLEAVKSELDTLWQRCAHVAALCYVLARKYTKLNPDEAMFVGLMHGIGRMYVLVRAEELPAVLGEEGNMLEIMDEWGSAIGAGIIENWGFADHVATAIGNYEDTEHVHEGNVDYTDVLILAFLMYQFVSATDDTEIVLNEVPASRLLELSAADMINVLSESEEQITSLRRALGK